MKKESALKLLQKTKSDYDKLAVLFQEKRSFLTPDILYLKKFAENGDKILDLGCGFGRLNEVFKDLDIDYIGTDISSKQIKLAQQTYPNKKFLQSKLLIQPFEDNVFDKVFCLSVIHHIPSKKLRGQFLNEIKRILKPEGQLILTAWYLWDNPKIISLIDKFDKQKLELDKNDIIFPFKNNQGKIIAKRYIHCFKQDELKELIKDSGFKIEPIKILPRDKKGENRNILAVCQNKS